jgi:hypothetical protein
MDSNAAMPQHWTVDTSLSPGSDMNCSFMDTTEGGQQIGLLMDDFSYGTCIRGHYG